MKPLFSSNTRRGVGDRRGYVMLIAMLFIAILAVIGASTLQVAGIDQRIALQNRKHMLVVNTSHAGTEHARYELINRDPVSDGLDTGVSETDTASDFIQAVDAEANFGGLAYTHNLGVYWVEATYHRAGNPPPGFSTEIGNTKFRSDYWEMKSTARMQDTLFNNTNETQATSSSLIRKVKVGAAKIRIGFEG